MIRYAQVTTLEHLQFYTAEEGLHFNRYTLQTMTDPPRNRLHSIRIPQNLNNRSG